MIVTITGDNAVRRDQILQQLVADFVAAHGEIAVERMDGDEASFEQLQASLQTLPFLAERQLVVLRSPGTNKQFAAAAEMLLADLPDSTDVIVVEPKLDKRSVYYKLLKKATDFRDCVALDERGLAQWLGAEAKAQAGSITQSDALFLVERVGADQQLLANELEKLLLYEPAITRATIELLTEATPQSSIFELIEAAFAGRTARALQLFDEQRALKVEPPQIIAMLAWQLHVLAIIATAGQRSAETIAAEAKLSPYVVKKTATLSHRLPRRRLATLAHQLSELDYRLKQAPLNADEALKYYLLELHT